MRPRSVLIIVLAALVLAGCLSADANPSPQVLASFYPLEYLAQRLAPEGVSVASIVRYGQEPHDYEPSPKDLQHIGQARLLVLQGAGFEGWIQTAQEHTRSARVVTLTDGLDLLANPEEEEAAVLPHDPHTWLDPVLYQQMARILEATMVETFPEQADEIRSNAQRLAADLAALHAEHETGLARCEVRLAIVNHAAYQYYALRYNWTQVPIHGLAPESEPDARTLDEILRVAREHDLKVVYFEELASPHVIEAIARDVGATTRVLSPVEGIAPGAPAGTDYLSLMQQNLQHLREGMRCP